jgi:hypothetical protein
LRAPEGFELSYLTVALEHEGAAPHALDQSRRKNAHIEPDGRFRFSELEAGRWTLTVRQPAADPIAREEKHRDRSGQHHHAASRSISARTLRKLRITVVDERGAPLPEAQVMIASREKSGRQGAMPVRERRVRGAGGRRRPRSLDRVRRPTPPCAWENVTTDQRVVLAEGNRGAHHRGAAASRSRTARATIGLRFDNVDATAKLFSRRGRGFEGYFAQGREFGSKAPLDGIYRATWIVRTEKEGLMNTLNIEPPATPPSRSRTASPKTTYELVPPAGILERAKGKLFPAGPALKRLLLALVAVAALGLIGRAIYRALASEETKIGWLVDEHDRGLRRQAHERDPDRPRHPVFLDETYGADRDLVRAALVRLFFEANDETTEEVPLPRRVERQEHRRHAGPRQRRARPELPETQGRVLRAAWKARVKAQLQKKDGYWRFVRTETSTPRGPAHPLAQLRQPALDFADDPAAVDEALGRGEALGRPRPLAMWWRDDRDAPAGRELHRAEARLRVGGDVEAVLEARVRPVRAFEPCTRRISLSRSVRGS